MQQRPERRHVHEFYGLLRRRGHVHVHGIASGSYDRDAHRTPIRLGSKPQADAVMTNRVLMIVCSLLKPADREPADREPAHRQIAYRSG